MMKRDLVKSMEDALRMRTALLNAEIKQEERAQAEFREAQIAIMAWVRTYGRGGVVVTGEPRQGRNPYVTLHLLDDMVLAVDDVPLSHWIAKDGNTWFWLVEALHKTVQQ